MTKDSYYTKDELENIGFKNIGCDVLISRKSSIYSPERISIGNHVRIDDFCFLSGNIELGNYIHISAGVYIIGGEAGVIIKNYASVSSQCSIYAATDDYSGQYMSNPTLPREYRHVVNDQVILGEHVIIGTHSVILPGIEIGRGAAVGAMSILRSDVKPFIIIAGNPARKVGERSRDVLKLQSRLEQEAGPR